MSYASVDEVRAALDSQHYLADEGLATAVYLAVALRRPLLLEGEAGVGKTELAKVLAAITGGELIRLQCYEGIDMYHALYEWDYARQMLHIRALGQAGEGAEDADLFGERFLVERPLLKATRAGDKCVLLIDEIDRADDEFEAFLLELLGDFQVTIPEVGTVRSSTPPIVILTSNRTRELHDALKRRCLYSWIGFPEQEREVEIVRTRAPRVSATLVAQVVAAVHRLRAMELEKLPGIAETIDWTESLDALAATNLDESNALDTLGAVVKDRDDLEFASRNIRDVVS